METLTQLYKGNKKVINTIVVIFIVYLASTYMYHNIKEKAVDAKKKKILNGSSEVNILTANLTTELNKLGYWDSIQPFYNQLLALNDSDFFDVMTKFKKVNGKSLESAIVKKWGSMPQEKLILSRISVINTSTKTPSYDGSGVAAILNKVNQPTLQDETLPTEPTNDARNLDGTWNVKSWV